jgi:programmed cell death protein 4
MYLSNPNILLILFARRYLIRQMQLLLKEYIVSGELEEAVRCLQELEVPHFHHELVYEAILMAIEDMGEKTPQLISNLLKSLSSSAIVSVDQLKNGFSRIYRELDDIVLDTPLAYQNLERFVAKCGDFIPRDLVNNCPTRYVLVFCICFLFLMIFVLFFCNRGRKRFVSEGDGGLVKDQ